MLEDARRSVMVTAEDWRGAIEKVKANRSRAGIPRPERLISLRTGQWLPAGQKATCACCGRSNGPGLPRAYRPGPDGIAVTPTSKFWWMPGEKPTPMTEARAAKPAKTPKPKCRSQLEEWIKEYRQILGTDLPESLEDVADLRSTEPRDWGQAQALIDKVRDDATTRAFRVFLEAVYLEHESLLAFLRLESDCWERWYLLQRRAASISGDRRSQLVEQFDKSLGDALGGYRGNIGAARAVLAQAELWLLASGQPTPVRVEEDDDPDDAQIAAIFELMGTSLPEGRKNVGGDRLDAEERASREEFGRVPRISDVRFGRQDSEAVNGRPVHPGVRDLAETETLAVGRAHVSSIEQLRRRCNKRRATAAEWDSACWVIYELTTLDRAVAPEPLSEVLRISLSKLYTMRTQAAERALLAAA